VIAIVEQEFVHVQFRARLERSLTAYRAALLMRKSAIQKSDAAGKYQSGETAVHHVALAADSEMSAAHLVMLRIAQPHNCKPKRRAMV